MEYELHQLAHDWFYDKCHGQPDEIIDSLFKLLTEAASYMDISWADIRSVWDDKLGVLTDKELDLMWQNIRALHEANKREDIKHIINVWLECGVQ